MSFDLKIKKIAKALDEQSICFLFFMYSLNEKHKKRFYARGDADRSRYYRYPRSCTFTKIG